MTLPTNIDVTYGDDAGDASVKLHQQHHDTIHAFVNSGAGAVSWTGVKTANYAASAGDAVRADASGGNFNVTLPAPTANARVTVKNVGATGTATVLPHGAETIDGASSYPIATQWTSRDFQSDGTNWLVV